MAHVRDGMRLVGQGTGRDALAEACKHGIFALDFLTATSLVFSLILTNPGHFVGTKLSNGSILPKLSHWPSQSAWLASQNSLRQNYIKADGLLTTYTHTKFVCDCVHW